MAVPLVIVVVLNPVYIAVFKWGIAGSALAMVTADAFTLVLRIWYYYSRYSVLKIRWRYLRIDWQRYGEMFKCGSAAMVGQVAAFFVFAEMLWLTNIYGGTAALAVSGVVQPIIGYNYGSGNYLRMRSALNKGIIVATIIAVFFFAVCELFPVAVIGIFSMDSAATELGVKALRVFVCSFPLIGYAIVASEYFPAVNKPAIGVWLTILRQMVFILLPMYWLAQNFGLFGIFWSLPLSDVLATVTAYLFLRREFAHLRNIV